MKTQLKIFVSLLVFLSLNSSSLFAQKTVIWKGGTPGRETQWQHPGNWSGNHAPDEFSDVIIPDVSTARMAYPVVNGSVEINSLRLESNVVLTIAPEGRLTVLNDLIVLHPTNLIIKGDLKIMEEMEANISQNTRDTMRKFKNEMKNP